MEFREKEQRIVLPRIRQVDIHNPIDSIGRMAEHSRITESGYRNIQTADLHSRIMQNFSGLRLESSEPVSSRFAKMLRSIPSR